MKRAPLHLAAGRPQALMLPPPAGAYGRGSSTATRQKGMDGPAGYSWHATRRRSVVGGRRSMACLSWLPGDFTHRSGSATSWTEWVRRCGGIAGAGLVCATAVSEILFGLRLGLRAVGRRWCCHDGGGGCETIAEETCSGSRRWCTGSPAWRWPIFPCRCTFPHPGPRHPTAKRASKASCAGADQPLVKLAEGGARLSAVGAHVGGLRLLVIENLDWRPTGQKQLATIAAGGVGHRRIRLPSHGLF